MLGSPAGLEPKSAAPRAPRIAVSRPPKVVHIATVARTLGFLNGQIRYLKARGFEIEGIAADDGTMRALSAENGIPMHAVPMTRRIDPLGDLVALVRLWRLLRRMRPDVVHTHTPKGGLLGNLAAALARVPIRIQQIHGLPHLAARGRRRSILRASEKLAASLATKTICVSPSIMRAAIEDGISTPDKAMVLIHGSADGIDAEALHPARHAAGGRRLRREFGIPDGAIVVGCVARLVPDKGLPELAEAWVGIREQAPDAHLLLVGTDEPEHPLPARTRELLSTVPHIYIGGFRSDMGSVYAALDLLVLPSHREGMPSVLLEGAAMALPIVTTNVPGCIDAVEPGRTATLVEVNSPADLAAAVLRYIGDLGLRREHGAAGRARVVRLFERTAIWSAVLEEYTRLLEAAAVRK